MAGRRLVLTLDEPLLDALHGEGARTCEPASRVAERVLRMALPQYVGDALRRDLAPVVRARVLTVRRPADGPSDAAPPLPSGKGVTSESRQIIAGAIIPPSARPRSGGACAAR